MDWEKKRKKRLPEKPEPAIMKENRYEDAKKQGGCPMEILNLKLSGMETERDPKKVRRAAKQFEGVEKVIVDAETGAVEVHFDMPATANIIKLAIQEEGFTVTEA